MCAQMCSCGYTPIRQAGREAHTTAPNNLSTPPLQPRLLPHPGWFHEVTSYGAAGPANATTNGNPSAGSSAESSTGGGHLAFNYWFHPPDRLDPSRTTGFNRPYTSDYWPALWRARCAAGLPGGMEPGLGAQPPPAAEGPGEQAVCVRECVRALACTCAPCIWCPRVWRAPQLLPA